MFSYELQHMGTPVVADQLKHDNISFVWSLDVI